MSVVRFPNMYKILKDIESVCLGSENEITADLLCIICNKILINAQFAPCGCKYCMECITAYLEGGDKYCLGNTNDCKNELLNINININTDQPMNIKISRLIVKCPERECDMKVELKKLEEHFRVCNWRPKNCPFFNVGCRNVERANDKIYQHLLSENHTHTRLLNDSFDVIKNEVGQLKEEMTNIKNMKEEMREMREEIKVKQIVIDDLRAVITQQYKEIDQLGIVNREMRDKINDLGKKMESYEAVNLEMRINGEKQMKDKLEQIESKGSDCIIKIDGLVERISTMAAQQSQLNYGEFVWPIDNFSDKQQKVKNGIDTFIFSDVFFSHKNGYQMRLSVDPDGGDYLSVYFHLISGPFDDILEWPFKYDVTIAIVNRFTCVDEHRKTFKYDLLSSKDSWRKPITGRNGFPQFIEFDRLLNDSALYDNDRIFIKCTVHVA